MVGVAPVEVKNGANRAARSRPLPEAPKDAWAADLGGVPPCEYNARVRVRPHAPPGFGHPMTGTSESMARKTATLTTVFADISGSTRLYELLGDAVARRLRPVGKR